MKKEKVKLGNLTLIGLTARTNNKNEMKAETAKIGNLVGVYFQKNIASHFKNRANPGVTYSVYTEYESDERGEYTYFIGEEVSSLEDQDLSQFKSLIIPANSYQKFTTEAGKMPNVVIAAWQDIWKMKENELGGQRDYIADFEIYDQRACDPHHAIVDIYIGI